jgi:hypothetical protein
MHLQNFKKWEGAELYFPILISSFSVEEQILAGKKRKFSKQGGGCATRERHIPESFSNG